MLIMEGTATGGSVIMKMLMVIGLIIILNFVFVNTTFAKYYGRGLCSTAGFHCVNVKRGDTWQKKWPNPRERNIIKRLNRTNLPLHYRSWVVVPDDLASATLMGVSPFPDHINAPGHKTIYINLREMAFGAYNPNGELVHWGPASGGKGFCPDVNRRCTTILGSYKIFRKEGRDCISSKFPIESDGGAPMPFCMFFYRGYAMHASSVVPGYHASHGCVRLFYADAKWLNKYFITHGAKGTRVIVTPY